MYKMDDIRAMVNEIGVRNMISFLNSDRITEEQRASFKSLHVIYDDGCPCLSLLYALCPDQ